MHKRLSMSLAALTVAAGHAHGQTFTGFSDVLGDGTEWYQIDIADDGRSAALEGRRLTGVGSYERSTVFWNADTGFTPIAAPGPNTDSVETYAIAGDGSRVVLRSGGLAYEWTPSGGSQQTPAATNATPYWARDVSRDGTRFTGRVRFPATDIDPERLRGARWNAAGEVEFLDVPIGDVLPATEGSAISRNGEWVAGRYSDPSVYRAALWAPDGAWIDLAEAVDPIRPSNATTVSDDGAIVFGGVFEFGRGRAWRWEDGVGTVLLDFHSPTHDDMSIVDATPDGAIAAGRSGLHAVETIAVVWDETNGTRSVQDLLVNDFGLDLGGWQLTTTKAISADGTVLAGQGVAPDGDFGVWIVTNVVLATACRADTNGDGVVSPADLNGWILAFNAGDPAADQNGDGLLSPADFNAWIANFNLGC